MLLRGKWLLCPDKVVRPVLHGQVLAADGSWVRVTFLVDIAADRTVISASVLAALDLPTSTLPVQLAGVGGTAHSVLVETQLQFLTDGGDEVVFRGQFAALTDPKALDMSVLGRDITNLFAVIVDWPNDFVGLLGQRHQYTIVEC